MNELNSGFVLKTDQIKYLSPDERENYIRNVIKEILGYSEDGVTISEVSDLTGFNRVTVAKHLEHLTSIRESYKKERKNGSIYYKNGKLIHPTGKSEIDIGRKKYAFLRLENNEGQFLYIQEKEEDFNRAVKIKGGILIPLEKFQDFMNGLMQFTMNAMEIIGE